jgi:hypothetical protein
VIGIFLFEIVGLVSDNWDEIIEMLVEVNALRIVKSEFVVRMSLGLSRITASAQVRSKVLYSFLESFTLNASEQFQQVLAFLCCCLLRGDDGFELVDDEIVGATLCGIVEGKEVDGVVKSIGIVNEADARTWFFLSALLTQHQHPQDKFFIELLLCGFEIEIVGSKVDFFGLDGTLRWEVGADEDGSILILDGINGDFRVKDVGRAVNGCDSAESLRNVTNSIVNVKIGNLAVDAAALYELAKLFYEAAQSVEVFGEDGDRSFVVVLVIADDICEIVHYLLVFLHQLLQKGEERVFQLLLELHVQLFLDVSKPLVELLSRVVVLGQLLIAMEDLD